MKETAVIIMVLSGLCFLPACFPRLYILVDQAKTWAEAQSYCRWKYTDLAAVRNELDLAKLNDLIGSYDYIWIGLHTDTEAWRWCLENQDYYGGEEAGFRMWAHGEPNAGLAYYKVCASMLNTGEWVDVICSATQPFICYNGTVGTEDTSSSFIFVNKFKTWSEAQSYCREHYTDLTSVRNQAENEQMKSLTQNEYTWIGLYRDSWKWSDGSAHSFSNWAPSAPSTTPTDSCAVSNSGKWLNQNCNRQQNFVCYSAPTMRKQVVQVVLKKTDSSVDVEELKEDILQKFNQRLKDHSLSEEVKLRWVEQPDGKVFHKKNIDKKEKKRCTLK